MEERKRVNILIADKDEIFYQRTKNLLNDSSYTIKYAGDGQETIDIVKSQEIDIVVLNLYLPVINGFDVHDMIRSFNNEIIFIVQIDEEMPEEMSTKARRNCSGYGISNPLIESEFIRVLGYCLNSINRRFPKNQI